MKKKGGRKSKAKKTKKEAPFFRPLEAALRDKLAKEAAKKKQAASPKPAQKPPPPSPDEPDFSEDDRSLFRQYMAGTVPLDRKGARIPRTASSLEQRIEKPAKDAPDPDDEARARLRALVEGTSPFEVVDDGLHIEGKRADVDSRSLRRLRHGKLPIDARLDLHGMTLAEAKREVQAFVLRCRQSHERVLLIIHGKGNNSVGGVGVLRGEIGAWLSEGPASHHVACFATARNEDGGSGAIYVKLRK